MHDDVLDLPSLETVVLKQRVFEKCHVAVFESMFCFHLVWFSIPDLPKLHTISFNCHALAGDNRYICQTVINGHESQGNRLIMRSKLVFRNMNCCVVMIRSSLTHYLSLHWWEWRYSWVYRLCCVGKYDLTWLDLNRYPKSHWKQHSTRRMVI